MLLNMSDKTYMNEVLKFFAKKKKYLEMNCVNQSTNNNHSNVKLVVGKTIETSGVMNSKSSNTSVSPKPCTVNTVNIENMHNVLSFLCQIFSGELKCNFCRQPILFNSEYIPLHKCLQNFIHDEMNIGYYSKSTHTALQKKELVRNDTRNENNLKLIQLEKTANIEMTCDKLKNESVFLKFQTFLLENFADLNNASTLIKFYSCLSCNEINRIEMWDEHILKYHTSENILKDVDNNISCICTLCEHVLFGNRKLLVEHKHFIKNKVFFSLHSYPHLLNLLEDKGLPRYHVFLLKLLSNKNESKLGFYCLNCNFFCFSKPENHLNSSSHIIKASFQCDLYFCHTCYAIFYGDFNLFSDHVVSPTHIYLKKIRKDRNSGYVESEKHKNLLNLLKQIIEKNLSDYEINNNLQRYCYYCVTCEYDTNNQDIWIKHVNKADHKKRTINEQKEYICIFCKLSIFGTIHDYAFHTLSISHKQIKSLVLDYRNKINEFNVKEFSKMNEGEHYLNTHFSDLLFDYNVFDKQESSVDLKVNENLKVNSEVVKESTPSISVTAEYSQFNLKVPNDDNKSNSLCNVSTAELFKENVNVSSSTPTKMADNNSILSKIKPNSKVNKCDNNLVTVTKNTNIIKSKSDLVNAITHLYDLYSETMKVSGNISSMTNTIKLFVKKILSNSGFTKIRCYNCWFCGYYLSEKSWWHHINHSPHLEKITSHCNHIQSFDCLLIFCYSCNMVFLGNKTTQIEHTKTSKHLKRKLQLPEHDSIIMTGNEQNYSNENEKLMVYDKKEKNSSEISPSMRLEENLPNTDKSINKFEHWNHISSADLQPSAEECSNICNNDERSSEDDADGDDLYKLITQVENDPEKVTSDDEVDEEVMLNELRTDIENIESKNSKVDGNSSGNPSSEELLVRHLIVVKGIPNQILRNRKFLFNTFSKYGIIKRTYPKKGSCYILVLTEPEEMFQNLKANIETLKKKLGTDELVIEKDTRSSDSTELLLELTPSAKMLFSDRKELENAIFYLIHKYHAESTSFQSQERIKFLEDVITKLAQQIYYNIHVPVRTFVFGSRIIGLATENSDVDIYLQIGYSFRGTMHNNTNLQQQLVILFANRMKLHPTSFANIISIPFARVPIVKFTHLDTNLTCDLSFKSGLSTMNSLLVKTYLDLDERIRYLVCAVKLWMKLNNLADRMFTTYAQIWMVLFFLMQPQIAVVPTVLNLRLMLPPQLQVLQIEGWNSSFPNSKVITWRTLCALSKDELLLKFFEFYSDLNLFNYVLSTLTGLKIDKKHFLYSYDNLPSLPYKEYKQKMTWDKSLNKRVIMDFKNLCIQDPFDHCHNLTKTINATKFNCFTELCKKTVELIKP